MSSSASSPSPDRPAPGGHLRWWRALRVVTIVAVVASLVAVAAFVLGRFDRPSRTFAKPRSGEIDVFRALATDSRRSITTQVAVRGFVFSDEAGLRLCRGKTGGSPPTCAAPYLALAGVNEGSFALHPHRAAGHLTYWSSDPVTVVGTTNGAILTVSNVVQ